MLEILTSIIWLFVTTNDNGNGQTSPASPHDRHLYPNY